MTITNLQLSYLTRARRFLARSISVLLLTTTCAWAQQQFDHFSTGFDLNGAHSNVTCEGCHARGTFEGTNSACVSCHSRIGLVQSSMKPMNHVSSTEFCADCHTTAAWTPISYMDHSSVTGSCGSCHNGFSAAGKSPDHIASSDNCDNCHRSTLWLPAVFDHATVMGNCAGCHNGRDAIGKDPMHILTTNVCEDCHSTITWSPATNIDHNQVLGSCGSCHNGTTATGTDPGHFMSTQDCNYCHTTMAWMPDTFMHTMLTYEPLDHAGNQECTDCHQSNSDPVMWPSPTYQPSCAGCHANDYRQEKHEGPNDTKETVAQNQDCAGACHQKSSHHRISDGNWD